METGKYLAHLRKQQGLSLRQLAAKAHVHYVTVYNVEHGLIADPRVSILIRLADAFGIELTTMLRRAANARE
jgi:transcriptional regulator with XRE-family HTH domain